MIDFLLAALLTLLNVLVIGAMVVIAVTTVVAVQAFINGFRQAKRDEPEPEPSTPDVQHSGVWTAPEPPPTYATLSEAFQLVASHGEKMHVCSNCKSSKTDLTRIGYQWHEPMNAMVVVVAERCMDCDQRIQQTMTGFSWACAMLRSELAAWVLAQESADMNFEIQRDLKDLDDQDPS